MKLQYKILCIISSFFVFVAHAVFDYDRAVSAAQTGDFEKADTLLSSLMIDHPERPDLLYDAGVVACKKKDFKRARACFEHACLSSSCPLSLQEQAHFNCGNACVEQKELKQAIQEYEKVLHINPKNDRARHNLEVVKKMLEQQQQQNKDQNKNQQNNDKQDQKNQDKKKNDNKDQQDNNKQQEKDQQQDKNKQDQKKQQDKQEQDDKNKKRDDQNKDDQQKQDHDKDQEKKQDKSDQNQSASDEKKPEQQKKDDASRDEQSRQERQQEQGGDKKESAEQHAAGKGQKNQYDEQVMNLLNAIEKKDAQVNKKMVAAQIKQAVGTYDKNKNNY